MNNMPIQEMIDGNHLGLLSNFITLHRDRLGVRKDPGDTYEFARDIIIDPKRFKDIIKKMKDIQSKLK